MKIASWNVNSLRVRLEHLQRWCDSARPDLLLLQETKVADDAFPAAELAALGYHAVFRGQKTYNGVAILGREPLQAYPLELPEVLAREQRLCAVRHHDVLVLSVYVPNGSEVGAEKYHYKLQWLEALAELLGELLREHPKLIVAGDFNIAPEDRDVYDADTWHEAILCSSPERAALQKLFALGLADTFRLHHREGERYSWWDYRAAAFARNRGLRIDLILASLPLLTACGAADIDTAPRGWERPSDHAPILAEFNLPGISATMPDHDLPRP